MYGNIARNFVKYGYWGTRLGPVVNSGDVSAGEFEFYYHYPPLLVWLVSLSYRVFGVYEWSARLVPLLFSLASMGLVFIFARYTISENVALLALLFSTVMPVESYYGAHVDVYGSIAVFFSLLALYGYSRWLGSHLLRDLALCNLGVVLGCMTSWYTYFLVPLIVAHYYFFYAAGGEPRDHRLLSVAGSAVVVFVLFLLHRHLLLVSSESEVHGTLIEKLLARMSYGNMLTAAGVLQHVRDLVHMYSPPLLILTAIWFLFFIFGSLKDSLKDQDWFVFILLSYGFLHNLAFPGLLPGHDYIVVCYAPGIAIAASIVFVKGGQYIESTKGLKARNAAVAITLAIILTTGLYMTRQLYSYNTTGVYALKRWGEVILNNSDDVDVILLPTRKDHVFQYYVSREMEFEVDTPQKIIARAEEKDNGYLFVCPVKRADKFKNVLDYLDGKYPKRNEDGLIIYTIPGRR